MTHDELLSGIQIIERVADGMWGTKALRAAVELHKPKPVYRGSTYGWEVACYACKELPKYPCLTIQTIEKELE